MWEKLWTCPSHSSFCPRVLAQGRLRYQITENLECGNDGTDLGDRIKKETWEKAREGELSAEEGGQWSIFWSIQMVPDCSRRGTFLGKPPHSLLSRTPQ